MPRPTARRTLTLALALTPGVGAKTITRVLTRCDLFGTTPDDFLKLGPEALKEEFRLKPKQAETWHNQKQNRLQEAAGFEDRVAPFGVTLVTAADAHYPRQLEAFDPDPPGLLYLYGNTRLLGAPTSAVLSSRKSPPDALHHIELRTEENILRGRTIVTGHDTPEYQRSAVTCLRWGSPRILVLDTGFFPALGENLKEEPFAAARLWRYQFDPATDLALSSVHPDRNFHRGSNRLRDRLVAGLAFAHDFIHVAPAGNMERLARLAVRAGRPATVSTLAPAFDALTAAGLDPLPYLPR